MSKKQMNKKKIAVKLTPGDTAIVINYEIAMHIAESYDFFANDADQDTAQWYRDVADTIRYQAMENFFENENNEEEW